VNRETSKMTLKMHTKEEVSQILLESDSDYAAWSMLDCIAGGGTSLNTTLRSSLDYNQISYITQPSNTVIL